MRSHRHSVTTLWLCTSHTSFFHMHVTATLVLRQSSRSSRVVRATHLAILFRASFAPEAAFWSTAKWFFLAVSDAPRNIINTNESITIKISDAKAHLTRLLPTHYVTSVSPLVWQATLNGNCILMNVWQHGGSRQRPSRTCADGRELPPKRCFHANALHAAAHRLRRTCNALIQC